MQFAVITLKVLTPLHIGSGRCGILARSYGFVPGHLLVYALASVIGKHKGAQETDFQAALEMIRNNVRCGPLFIEDAEKQKVLLPHQNQQRIETHYLIASNHATLDPETRVAIKSALFEVEAIAAHQLRGEKRGEPTRLKGGIWYENDLLENRPLSEWINQCYLGGEIKAGFGRIECQDFKPETTYPGIKGECEAQGICLKFAWPSFRWRFWCATTPLGGTII